MTPLVRDLVAAAVGFLPRPADMARIERQARLSELRLLLAEAEHQYPLWPNGARALVTLLRAVAEGRAASIPAGSIGLACDDRWPQRAAPCPAWMRRADCGSGEEGRAGE